MCNNGAKQSPINLISEDFQTDEDAIISIDASEYSMKSGKLHNDGQMLRWFLDVDEIMPTFKSPTSPNATFDMHRCDFHWGACDDVGSEHKVDGNSYPLEMQCIHHNTKYDMNQDYLSHADGVAVLLFFFKVGTTNTDMEDVFSNLPLYKTMKVNSTLSTSLEIGTDPEPATADLPEPVPMPFDIKNSVLDKVDLTKFFYYQGSLTQPGCHEAVTYVAFRDAIQVSPEQLDSIREVVVDEAKGQINGRPIQDTNDRKLTKSFNEDFPVAAGSGLCATAVEPRKKAAPSAAFKDSPMVSAVLLVFVGMFISYV